MRGLNQHPAKVQFVVIWAVGSNPTLTASRKGHRVRLPDAPPNIILWVTRSIIINSPLYTEYNVISSIQLNLGLKVFTDAHDTVTVEEGDRYPLRPPS